MSATFRDTVTRKIAAKHDISITAATTIFKTIFEDIKEEITNGKVGGRISIHGFGAFNKVHRKARAGHNPATGKPLTIAAIDVITFKSHMNK